MHRVAYLCCELKSRDLESRLLIASHLLKAGIPVVVGQVWALVGNARARRNLPGCYLFATANHIQAKGMNWVQDAGNAVLASNEETFALAGERILDSLAPEAMAFKFLSHNDRQSEIIRNRFPAADITVTGSSRAELLRSMSPRPVKPPYVLFNTSFGLINSVWGNTQKALEILGRGMRLSDEEVKARINAQNADAQIMVEVIHWAQKSYRVVIRPHPSERASTWRMKFPTAEVIEGSAPLPWIRDALVLVHANSTTGLEAALMGVPAVNINPTESWGARFITHEFNRNAETTADAISAIQEYIEGKRPPPVPENLFPSNGAKNSAEVIAQTLSDATPLSGDFSWAPMERDPHQQAKFTAGRDDIVNSTALTGSRLATVHELDDSVFLLVPN